MADKALDLFEKMSVNPNNFIHAIVFKACASLANERSVSIGKKLLNQISNELPMNNIISSSAVHMLTRLHDIQSAERIFERTKNKDAVAYGAMMQGNYFSYQLQLES